MREQLTQSVEDYLKIIYVLTAEYGRAMTTQIAEHMGVKPGSVTGMLQKMAETDPPLINYQKHRGAVLTPQGEQAALEVIRHHRLLELFLYKTLGYTWDEVHSEADLLEHVISEDLEERIAEALGNPTRDPHGEPIPTRNFHLPPQSSLRLSDLRPGNQARVQRVDSADEKLLCYLGGIGLVPLAQVTILDYSVFDDNLRLWINGQPEPVVLGTRVTNQIFMEDFNEQ